MRSTGFSIVASLALAGCATLSPGPDGWFAGRHAIYAGDLEQARRVMHAETARREALGDAISWMVGLQTRTDFAVLLHDAGMHEAAGAELRVVLDRIDATSLDVDTSQNRLPATLRANVHTHLLLARLAGGDLEGARVEARRFASDLDELAEAGLTPLGRVTAKTTAHPLDTPDSALAIYLAALTWRLSGRADEAERWQASWAELAPEALAACPPGVAPGCAERGEHEAELVVVVRSGLQGWSPCSGVEVVVDGVAHEALRLSLFREVDGSGSTELTASDTWLAHVVVEGLRDVPRRVEVRGRTPAGVAPGLECALALEAELELAPGGWQLLSLRDDSCHPLSLAEAHQRPVGQAWYPCVR